MSLAQLRSVVSSEVDGQLTVAAGRLEAVTGLAVPVALAVAGELAGIPRADRLMAGEWATRIDKAFAITVPDGDRKDVDAAVTQLRSYLAATRPADVEAIDNLAFLFVSAFTKAVHIIAGVCAALVEHRGVFEQLRADRSLIPGAVEEILRYDAPLQFVSRIAAEAVDVDGLTIRRGRVVHLLLASANRDDRQFTDPDRLDIRRQPNSQLSFGTGRHDCIGAALTRLQAIVVVERLLDNCAVFESGGPVVRASRQIFRAFHRIPVHVRPGG
jgi:cytochrome P450